MYSCAKELCIEVDPINHFGACVPLSIFYDRIGKHVNEHCLSAY